MSNRWYKLIIIERVTPKPKFWGQFLVKRGDKYGYLVLHDGNRLPVTICPNFVCDGAVQMRVATLIGFVSHYVSGDDFEASAIIDHNDYWSDLRDLCDDETELQNRARCEIPWYAY